MVELTRERIDPAELMRRIKTVDAGGVAVFCGDVRRDGPQENPLVALEYSAHGERACVEIERPPAQSQNLALPQPKAQRQAIDQ